MKKRFFIFFTLLFLLIGNCVAYAAISFDAGTYSQAADATSLTFAHTTSGTDRILFVMGQDQSADTSSITGITYAGVAMTKITEVRSGAGDRMITIWILTNPASGANNVVVTSSVSTALRFSSVSYTGAAQSGQPDGSDTSTSVAASTISTDITTIADNSWMIMFQKDNSGARTYTSTTGDTVRLASDAGGHAIADSGVITPAGARTMTLQQDAGTNNHGAVSVSFKPVGVTVQGEEYTIIFEN